MEREQRVGLIESYGRAYQQLSGALAEFPREMWQFRSEVDPWTIHEIVIHIADSEVNSYLRCRRCIAEPGSTVTAYDENRWARELDYHVQDVDETLELFHALRRASHRLIASLPDEAWSRTIDHPENGIMTLDDWLGVYERHIPDHVAQMRRIYQAWLDRQA